MCQVDVLQKYFSALVSALGSLGYLLADHIVVRTYYFYHYITDTFVHRSSIVYDTKYLHTNSTTIKLDISFFENSSKFPFRLHVRSLLA